MKENIPDALIDAFERHYDTSWNDPALRNERLAWRAAWASKPDAAFSEQAQSLTYSQVVSAWNAQADQGNQWDELGEDEKIEWTVKCAVTATLDLTCKSTQKRLAAQGMDATDRECLAIGRAVNRAALELPADGEIRIDIENGAGSVYVLEPKHGDWRFIDSGDIFSVQINAAIDAAIAAQAKEQSDV